MSAVNDTPRQQSSVFIVDDDAALRSTLSALLSSAGRRVHAFASAAEFLASRRPAAEPTCLVLEAHLPGLSGLQLQRDLLAKGDRTPIIFITSQGDVATSVRAMKAGAMEFLTKPLREQDLLEAVELALTRDALQLREQTRLGEWRRRIATLSPRERQVLVRVVRGMLNKQIAADLDIAEITVKVHRRHVMDKTGAQSLAELVRMVDRVEPDLE